MDNLKKFLDDNGFRSLVEAQYTLDHPEISKCTVFNVFNQVESMAMDSRELLEYSEKVFIPVIKCKDGIIFAVRDLTGGFTGTFGSLVEGEKAFVIEPNFKEDK